MTISHYGPYSVGYSVVWCGPGPVARTGIQKVLCRDLPNINLLQNTQQLRTHFCGWSIHEVMLIEKWQHFVRYMQTPSPYIFRLSQYNTIILSIHSTAEIYGSFKIPLRETLQS